jgi:hypothetical protein
VVLVVPYLPEGLSEESVNFLVAVLKESGSFLLKNQLILTRKICDGWILAEIPVGWFLLFPIYQKV